MDRDYGFCALKSIRARVRQAVKNMLRDTCLIFGLALLSSYGLTAHPTEVLVVDRADKTPAEN